MARDQQENSHKLIYLSEHTRRRRRAESDGNTPSELEIEAHWLGRVLLATATATTLYWAAFLIGIAPSSSDEAWRWSASMSVGHLFLAMAAAIGGASLLRERQSDLLWVACAGGVAAVLALTGLLRGSIAGEAAAISNMEVLTHGFFAGLAIWTGSFLVRSERSHDR
ncbi:MAG: hypothetical protein ABGY42_01880 [bacterium]